MGGRVWGEDGTGRKGGVGIQADKDKDKQIQHTVRGEMGRLESQGGETGMD